MRAKPSPRLYGHFRVIVGVTMRKLFEKISNIRNTKLILYLYYVYYYYIYEYICVLEISICHLNILLYLSVWCLKMHIFVYLVYSFNLGKLNFKSKFLIELGNLIFFFFYRCEYIKGTVSNNVKILLSSLINKFCAMSNWKFISSTIREKIERIETDLKSVHP